MSASNTDTISLQDFARLTDKTIISDYVATYNIPNEVALPNGALGWYDLPAIMARLFPAPSNPVPINLVANHNWVSQPNGEFMLERTSAAEAFPMPPEDEIEEDPVPTLDHYPPNGLPADSSVDMVDAARRLEDGRLEVKAALERLVASVSEATFQYTQANLALDEEREKTASLMALVSNICGQGFADAIIKHVESVESVEGVEGNGEESNERKNNFVQKELQPSPWRAAVNKARFGNRKRRANAKEASDALREQAFAIMMPPPNFIPHRPGDSDDSDDDADDDAFFHLSRSPAISPRKRSRLPEDEDASAFTSPKRAKSSAHAESQAHALAESSFAAAMRGMQADLKRRSTEGHSHADSSASQSGEREKEPMTTGTSDGLQQSPSPSQPSEQAPRDQQGSLPSEALNPTLPPQQASGSSDPHPESSDSDSDSDASSSESVSPVLSWNSVVGAISNGISAAMAWCTNPPASASPVIEESISARRPIRPPTPPRPPTIYRPFQPRVQTQEPGRRRLARHNAQQTRISSKTGRGLTYSGLGRPGDPYIVEGDDYLDMESFYEKDPLSTLTRFSGTKTVGYMSDKETSYEYVVHRESSDAEVKEYCQRHLLSEQIP
ncbi:hypothetical protein IW261DRAFT_1657495 [Armillaria novae-zelandiae]|uniref:Uncharacterized protein n=1 Tax=Armillaria novae-zelandiae TaxID=153914 RepID=A0AA39TYK1_9AGAR|nr:hypothetical protein IW261DRAFT_1657495 [Armillaria novae-zelandiae]